MLDHFKLHWKVKGQGYKRAADGDRGDILQYG